MGSTYIRIAIYRVGRFLPGSGNNGFFHGKIGLAKIVFVSKNRFLPAKLGF